MNAETISQAAKSKEEQAVKLRQQGMKWAEIGEIIGTSPRYAADLFKRAGHRAKYAAQAESDALGGLSRRAASVLRNYNDSPTLASTTKAEWAEFVAARPERFDPRSKRKARGMSFGIANEIFAYLGLPSIEAPVAVTRACPHCGKTI